MKKKVLCLLLSIVLCFLTIMPAFAATRGTSGTCGFSVSGKSISFYAYNISTMNEDVIRATAYLWELRDGSWYQIADVSNTLYNTDYVLTSKTVTVSGGHYYMVTGSFYRRTGTVSYSGSASTSRRWVPA